MHLTPLMLVIPALIAPAPNPPPQLPTPTPGLGQYAQEINFAILKDGILVKTFAVDGRTYTLRAISNFMALYNDRGHAIVIARAQGMEINYGAGDFEGDPFPGTGEGGQVKVDGVYYTLKLLKGERNSVLAVYNEKGHIVFAMGDPDEAQIYIPRMVPET